MLLESSTNLDKNLTLSELPACNHTVTDSVVLAYVGLDVAVCIASSINAASDIKFAMVQNLDFIQVVNIKVEQSLSLEQFFLNLSFQKRVILHEWVSRMNQGSDLFPVWL